MIQLEIRENNTEIKLHGSDALIIDELASASLRILCALETNGGDSLEETTAAFILHLLDKKDRLKMV